MQNNYGKQKEGKEQSAKKERKPLSLVMDDNTAYENTPVDEGWVAADQSCLKKW